MPVVAINADEFDGQPEVIVESTIEPAVVAGSKAVKGEIDLRLDFTARASDQRARLKLRANLPGGSCKVRVTGPEGYDSGFAPFDGDETLSLPLAVMGENAFSIEVVGEDERHRGEEIEIRLACERFLPDVSQSAQRAQLSLILRKNLRSMVAYLPPDAIWALPGIIASKAITHVQVDCDELYRGVATGLSIYLSTLAEMHSLEARIVEGRPRDA